MRRILQIIPSLDRSGAEKQLVLLCSGLPRDEFDVHVCALTRGGPLQEDLERQQIPVTVIGKRWKADPGAYWRLRRHVAHLQPDLVHTWLFAANAYGRTAALAANVKRLIAAERCVDPWKTWHQTFIDRCLAARTNAIVVNSPGVRDFYVRLGLPAHKVRVIANGVSMPGPSTTPRAQVLAELGLPPGARLIGGVGRLWPQKRWKDLIWANDLLQVIRDDAHLLIIGEGPQRARLERYRGQCHMEKKVHFLGARDDVPRLMPHFDLLWLASAYEGMPNVVMEAMAAGIPVVASDISGNRDLVVHGETGYLVPVGERAGYARFANRILDDPALAQCLGQSGKERVGREFAVERMVSRHAALYREVLA